MYKDNSGENLVPNHFTYEYVPERDTLWIKPINELSSNQGTIDPEVFDSLVAIAKAVEDSGIREESTVHIEIPDEFRHQFYAEGFTVSSKRNFFTLVSNIVAASMDWKTFRNKFQEDSVMDDITWH